MSARSRDTLYGRRGGGWKASTTVPRCVECRGPVREDRRCAWCGCPQPAPNPPPFGGAASAAERMADEAAARQGALFEEEPPA